MTRPVSVIASTPQGGSPVGEVTPAERWRLPELVIAGHPVSDNRYKNKVIVRPRHGRAFPISTYTPEAEAWMAAVEYATLQAITGRSSGVPHPRDWPTPLRLTIVVRDGRLDLPNILKATLDALKGPLGVDDKHYELGGLTREKVTRATPQGARILIESAPLASASIPSVKAIQAVTVQQTATPRSRATTTRKRGALTATTRPARPARERRSLPGQTR